VDNLQDGIAEDMDVGIVVFSPFDSGDHTFHRTHFFYPMMNFLYPGHDRNTNSNGSHMEEGFHINYRMQIEFCQSKSSKPMKREKHIKCRKKISKSTNKN
jgi:hypothetical protein